MLYIVGIHVRHLGNGGGIAKGSARANDGRVVHRMCDARGRLPPPIIDERNAALEEARCLELEGDTTAPALPVMTLV